MNALQQILSSRIDGYTAPKKWHICDVPITYKPSREGPDTDEWREVLETWLPRFDSVGWLEDLTTIIIGDGVVPRDAVGRYTYDGSIYIENDTHLTGTPTVGEGPKHTLTHEVVHHAHIGLGEFSNFDRVFDEPYIREQVSWYAGEEISEAIAETATGIIHGYEYPDRVHQIYKENGGPTGAYELTDG